MQIFKGLAFISIFLLPHMLAVAAPSIALGYTPKYPTNFKHFDYVNPDAPKGGVLRLSGFGNFDSFNPFILKGVSVDGLGDLIFESLMVQSADEPYSLYGHIANDIKLARNKLSVTFKLNPIARFSDGSPILAKDVKISFDTIKSKKGHPYYRFYWADIKQAIIINKRTIRFDFSRKNPELHLIAAKIPVFSHKWVAGKSFDKLSKTLPIGSGPYTIGKYSLGKNITYQRNSDYWAKNLPTARGMYNFDKITYKYYKDSTVMLEALKAGEYDFKSVYHSKQWARDYTGDKFDSKQIIKEELKHRNNEGMQGFVFNTRRPLFKDKRVRRALTLAFDFSWSNNMLFYNQYTRCDSYFSNSELASSGLPEGKELALLDRYRKDLPDEVFNKVWTPPATKEKGGLRKNLIIAAALLKEAGWFIKDSVLQNKDGLRFEFDVLLAQKGFERILAPFSYNLRKLGIVLHYRTVDVSLYIRRSRTFDFDLMVASYPQKQSPGNELYNLWHSSSANEEGSRNFIGIKNKVVDKLIDHIVFAENRKEMIVAVKALDRVMLHEEYLIPNWYIAVHRIAYWDKFSYPKNLPLYYSAESWSLNSWWSKK